MTILLYFYVAAGLLLAVLALPLIGRKVGPNQWYGFRVRGTLRDPALWYTVNAFAAKGLLCVGLAICAAAVGLFFIPGIDLSVYALSVTGIAGVGLAIDLGLSFRYLARQASHGRPE